MRAAVPVFRYLSLVAQAKQKRFYFELSQHPVANGHVLFDDEPHGANNMHVLNTLLRFLNNDKNCPRCGGQDTIHSPYRGVDYHICIDCSMRWEPSASLPAEFKGFNTPVYTKGKEQDAWTGVDALQVGEAGLLEGWHRMSSEKYACRCPVHQGQTTTSMVVFNDGHFYFHMGCSGTEIYRVIKGLWEGRSTNGE